MNSLKHIKKKKRKKRRKKGRGTEKAAVELEMIARTIGQRILKSEVLQDIIAEIILGTEKSTSK